MYLGRRKGSCASITSPEFPPVHYITQITGAIEVEFPTIHGVVTKLTQYLQLAAGGLPTMSTSAVRLIEWNLRACLSDQLGHLGGMTRTETGIRDQLEPRIESIAAPPTWS